MLFLLFTRVIWEKSLLRVGFGDAPSERNKHYITGWSAGAKAETWIWHLLPNQIWKDNWLSQLKIHFTFFYLCYQHRAPSFIHRPVFKRSSLRLSIIFRAVYCVHVMCSGDHREVNSFELYSNFFLSIAATMELSLFVASSRIGWSFGYIFKYLEYLWIEMILVQTFMFYRGRIFLTLAILSFSPRPTYCMVGGFEKKYLDS